MTLKKPQRTFWTQINVPLVYAASTRAEVVPGSPTGMSIPKLVREIEAKAQLVSSLTEQGTHAPVIDIDFRMEVSESDDASVVRITCPGIDHEVLPRLYKHLRACGFTTKTATNRALSKRANKRGTVLVFTVPVQCVRSSTPRHYHLYIDHEISWQRYRWLLLALCDTGIIDDKFCGLSIANHASFLRRPGVKKIG